MGLIFASFKAIKELENDRVTKESLALARFAADYFAPKSENGTIDIWRYLPFSGSQAKPRLPITAEEEAIIRSCLNQLPSKFYPLYFEDFG